MSDKVDYDEAADQLLRISESQDKEVHTLINNIFHKSSMRLNSASSSPKNASTEIDSATWKDTPSFDQGTYNANETPASASDISSSPKQNKASASSVSPARKLFPLDTSLDVNDSVVAPSVIVEKPTKEDDKSKSKESKDKDKSKGKSKDKKRRVVSVGYKINCISNIHSINCTYELDAKIFYFWDDPKVVGREKGSSLKLDEEPDLFNPDIQITNGHNLEIEVTDVKVTDSKKGSVKMSIHAKGECFLTGMELHLFPFDCQNLLIALKPYKLPIEDVILVSKPEEDCAMDNNVTQEWDVFGHCTTSTTTDPATSSTNKSYSQLSIAVLVTRRPGWFINNVFIISLLLLFVSWSTFAMPAEERGEKMAISTSTLLAIIGNKYVVGNELPKLQYRTLCDQYVDFCFTLQIVAIGSFLLVYECSHYEVDGVGNLGALVNELTFALQLLSTVLFHYWLAWRLQEHAMDMHFWKSILVPEKERPPVDDSRRLSVRRGSIGCSFISLANYSRLDLDKLVFIEGCRHHTRIASFREALVYGRIEQRDNIAAMMFQAAWKAYRKRREVGVIRFNYKQFKEQLCFIEGARKMTRIAAFREAQVYKRVHIRDTTAALMFQYCWRAYQGRKKAGIKRISTRKSSLFVSTPGGGNRRLSSSSNNSIGDV